MLLADPPINRARPLEPLRRVLRGGGQTALVLFAEHLSGEGPIVAAIDGTAESWAAARAAQALAEELASDVVMVHVQRPEPVRTPPAARRRRREAEEVSAGVRRATGERSVEVLEGDPVERVLAYAAARGARLVVTGPAAAGADAWLEAGLADGVSFPVVVVESHGAAP